MATLDCLRKIREGLTPRLTIVIFEDVDDEIRGEVRYEMDGFGFPVINQVAFRADRAGKILALNATQRAIKSSSSQSEADQGG